MNIDRFLLVVFLTFGFKLVRTQSTPLNFGEITTCTCTSSSTNIQFSLTLPQWPLTPAQAFVLVLRSPGSNAQFPFTASVGGNSWGVLADTQSQDVGELWVPLQNAGTVVSVVVACASFTSYTIEPVIPAAINNSTNVPNFNFSSVSDDSTPHAHWWAVPVDTTSLAGYLWAELCEVPSSSNYLFNMRVVFPEVNVTGTTCTNEGTNTYKLSGKSNFRAYTSVSLTVSWLSNVVSVPVLYVSLYVSANLSPTSASYNLYTLNSNVPVEYSGTATGLFTGHGIQVENDLIISGITGTYYPSDTNVMKLYSIDYSNTELNWAFFTSACYLKTQAQSALFPGQLKNASQNSVVSKNALLAPNFFKGKTPSSPANTYTYALTYGDYVVLPNVQDATKLNGLSSDTNSSVIFYVMIGLAALSVVLLIGLVVMGFKLQRRGYASIQ